MKNSVMTHKRVLAIDGNLNFLTRLKNEISNRCLQCQVDTVTTFEDGRQLMLLLTYDLVISDPLNGPGSKLMDLAGGRNFPVLALSNNGASQQVATQFDKVKIPRVVSKNGVKSIVPVIEEVMRLESEPRWKRVLGKLRTLPGQMITKLTPSGLDRDYAGNVLIYY